MGTAAEPWRMYAEERAESILMALAGRPSALAGDGIPALAGRIGAAD